MQQRADFIRAWSESTMPMKTLCEVFGISRQTGHKLVRQFRSERTVQPESRRPKRQPRTPPRSVQPDTSLTGVPRWTPFACAGRRVRCSSEPTSPAERFYSVQADSHLGERVDVEGSETAKWSSTPCVNVW